MFEFEEALPAWIELKSPIDKIRQQILEIQVDKGELSAIALAIEMNNVTIILDYKARRVAETLGLEITGTIGVIIKAKLRGIIKSIKLYLAEIKETNFCLSQELEAEALRQAGE
jgi:predicted nucleic acid-binding protein